MKSWRKSLDHQTGAESVKNDLITAIAEETVTVVEELIPQAKTTGDFDPSRTTQLASTLLHDNVQFTGQVRAKRSLVALARVLIPVATGAISLATFSATLANLEATKELSIRLTSTTTSAPILSHFAPSPVDSSEQSVHEVNVSPDVSPKMSINRVRRSLNARVIDTTDALRAYFREHNLSPLEKNLVKQLLSSLVVEKLPVEQRQRLSDVTKAIAVSLKSGREKRAIGTLFAILIATLVPLVTSVAVELPLSIHAANVHTRQMEHQNNSTVLLLRRVEQLAAAQQSTSDQVLRLTTFLVKHGFPKSSAHIPAETIVQGKFNPSDEKVMDAVRRIEQEVDMSSWFDSITFEKSNDNVRKKRDLPHNDLLELKEDLILSNEIFSQQSKLHSGELEKFFNKTEQDAKDRLKEASTVLYVTASLVSAFFLSLLVLVGVLVYVFKTPGSRPLIV